ncbi:unnamed protein product [Spirodela intermedia]|uniref:Uncharacterized protein n=1 Tax=Spirodela intermedia TaxID=51605 RepID=A0A7I8J462_SPIIN|nr:unnamed protein product [Spirodela intermedia]CAA6664889.1 unnamed protein product [Spirodela intermedia]
MQWSSSSFGIVRAARRHPGEVTRGGSVGMATLPTSGRTAFGGRNKEVAEEVLGDDMRKVPTGANPLHNR